jgi:hypothetical protein
MLRQIFTALSKLKTKKEKPQLGQTSTGAFMLRKNLLSASPYGIRENMTIGRLTGSSKENL